MIDSRARSLPALLLVALAACASPAPATGVPEAPPPRPNIVLLMADDLGWGDAGYQGHPVLRTPHLDAMAADGLRFERFCAQSPVCSPTRGSVLTGRHPDRFGVKWANVGRLESHELTLAERLADVGYATGHFGKWHLGTLSADYSARPGRDAAADFMTPGGAGFETWFSTEHAIATWDPYDPANKHGGWPFDGRNVYWRDGEAVPDGPAEGLVGDDSRIIVDAALPFVRQAVADERPFFAVVWFHAPHAPVVAGEPYRALYAERSEAEQHYFGCVTALDEQVGRLRAELDALGVADDTLIAFCSDNGPEGNPGVSGRNQGTAGPLRGRKRSLYEGGVRVPGLMVWPARIAPGSTTDVPASTSDYLPTIVDLLELPDADGLPVDGLSLAPVLDGQAFERATPIVFLARDQRSVVDARFKLVHNLRDKRPRHDNGQVPFAEWELYDLLADPGETADLAARHPQVVAELRALLEAFVASCEASQEAWAGDG